MHALGEMTTYIKRVPGIGGRRGRSRSCMTASCLHPRRTIARSLLVVVFLLDLRGCEVRNLVVTVVTTVG